MLWCVVVVPLVFLLIDAACHSVMAPQCIHWRVSICRSWTVWLARNVKNKRRLLRKSWDQCIRVRHYIRESGNWHLQDLISAGFETVRVSW